MKDRFLYFLITILVFISTIYPTSENAIISSSNVMIQGAIGLIILIILFFFLNKLKINKLLLISATISILCLLLSTLFSSFLEVRAGSAIFYFSFIFLTLINFKNVKGRYYIIIFKLFCFMIVVFGIASLLFNDYAKNLLINNYSAYYEGLVNSMFSRQKPVTFFATHSIAGFIYFLLFYFNYNLFRVSKTLSSLLLSISFFILLIYMNSVTSTLFLILTVFFIIISLIKTKKGYIILSSTVVLFFITQFNKLSNYTSKINETFLEPLSANQNGISGRYSSEYGALNTSFDFLKNSNFKPIGFTYTDQVKLVDSGIMEYLIRGSFVLVLSLYFSLFYFFKVNITNKFDSVFLFLLFITFEIGFAGIVTPRIVFLIPFFVILSNSIDELRKQKNTY